MQDMNSKTFLTLGIISLGSHKQEIRYPNKNPVIICKSLLKNDDRISFGKDYIMFSTASNWKKVTPDSVLAFDFTTDKKGVQYLKIFRLFKMAQNPEYHLVTVFSHDPIGKNDIFSSFTSRSTVVSCAGFKGIGYETILLLKRLDKVRMDGDYYEFRKDGFRKSKVEGDVEFLDCIRNRFIEGMYI